MDVSIHNRFYILDWAISKLLNGLIPHSNDYSPINTDGLTVSTTSDNVLIGGWTCANLALCTEIPPSGRSFTISPLESTIQIFALASSSDVPSTIIACTQSSAMPIEALEKKKVH